VRIVTKDSFWKSSTFFSHGLIISLTLTLLFASVLSCLASSSPLNPKEALKEEIKSIASSDVENDISRRTEIIIKLYTDSSAVIKPSEIRKIYEEEYFRQRKAQFPQNLLHHPVNSLMSSILGAFIIGGLLGWVSSKISLMRATKVTVSIPFGIGSLELSVNSAVKRAAWLLYVELATRIATQSLENNEGLLREALDSLYKIFETTRQILKDAGTDVGMKEKSVGGIAMKVLNQGLRPFLAKWHPALEEWEAQRPETCSRKVHEQQWSQSSQMRSELELLKQGLQEYAKGLERISGVSL
jgi:hypothetical protein